MLRGEEARHAAQVLRLAPGERVLVADGTGRLAAARLTEVTPGRVLAAVEAVRCEPAPQPAVTVVAGLLKAGRLDPVIAKLTELGVARVAPAVCGRSVARLDARKRAAARERWTAIARAAAKQAHRATVPEILAAVAPLG